MVVIVLGSKYVTLTMLKTSTVLMVSQALCKDFLPQVGRMIRLFLTIDPRIDLTDGKPHCVIIEWSPFSYLPNMWFQILWNRWLRTYRTCSGCTVRNSTHNGLSFLWEFEDVSNSLPHGVTLLAPIIVLRNLHPKDLIREVVDFPPLALTQHKRIVELTLRSRRRERQRSTKGSCHGPFCRPEDTS